jgi:carotenoid cleavage dioxygenase-like enzyme
MHKTNTQENRIQWFTLPNHYTLHYVNAWEEKNELG